MIRHPAYTVFLLAGLVLCPASAAAPPPPNPGEIVDRIYQHRSDFEKTYPGTYMRRVMTVREFDPHSGKLRKTAISEQDVWTRAGQLPRIETVSCSVDGKDAEVDACKGRERNREPLYRVFGPDGRNYYRLKLLEGGPDDESSVYRLRVIPLERTTRHFEGELTFRADTLALLATQGSMADYPMGLKKFELKLAFEERDGLPIPTTTRIEMTLYIPLMVNMRVVSESVASDQRLLTE